MSRLFLLRHAKAGWALPGMRDFDRPLEASGVSDAQATGEAMSIAHYVPEMTLCSGALRARQTLQAIAEHADTGRVHFLDTLYSTDAAGYLNTIRAHGAHASLLVIGHNPMMEDLALAVTGMGDAQAVARLRGGFPTSGLAVIGFATELSGAEPSAGTLEAFLTPGEG